MESNFGIRDIAAEEFEVAKEYLLPNENVVYAFETEKGFVVATDRRLTYLERKKTKNNVSTYEIGHEPIPYDRLQSVFMKKEKARIEYPWADYGGNLGEMKKGQYEYYSMNSQEFKIPEAEKNERASVLSQFEEHVRIMSEKIQEIKTSEEFLKPIPPPRDYSYLGNLPSIITEDGIYEINAFLMQHLDADAVHPSIGNSIGDDPIILRNCYGTEKSGTILSIGSKGIIFVGGQRHNYHLSSHEVNFIPFESLLALHSREWGNRVDFYWMKTEKDVWRIEASWAPQLVTEDDKKKHPWLMLPRNGIWILSDIIYWKHGQPQPISFTTDEKKKADHRVRYLF